MQGSYFLLIVLTDFHLGQEISTWRKDCTDNSIKSLSFIQQFTSALSFISFQQLEAVYWVHMRMVNFMHDYSQFFFFFC